MGYPPRGRELFGVGKLVFRQRQDRQPGEARLQLVRQRQQDIHGFEEGHCCQPVCKDGENRWGLAGVVGPALAGGAPAFEEVAQRAAGDEQQQGLAVVVAAKDQQQAGQAGQYGQGFIDGWPYEGDHQEHEPAQDQPVGDLDGFIRDTPGDAVHEAVDALDGQAGDRPGRDDPQRRAFIRVIGPQQGLGAPAFDGQPAKDAGQDDPGVDLQVGFEHDGDGHEQEDADQEPVDLAPERDGRVEGAEIFLSQGPPDVQDQPDDRQEAAQQRITGAGEVID